MSKPDWQAFVRTFLRDVLLFGFGLVLIMKQAGIIFDPPEHGPNLYLIVLGGLFCNGPIVLQALSLRFGTGSQPSTPPPSEPGSPSAPSSASSSGGS